MQQSKRCRAALIRSLRLDVSKKSNQNAGKEMQMNLPECSVWIRQAPPSSGANRRSLTDLPFLSFGHVGPESAM